jgi:asparagine synthase (glutamine-hydrolysing)
VFGGYRSFREVPAAMRVSRRLGFVPRPLLRGVGRAVAWCILGRGAHIAQTRWAKLGEVLASRGRCVDLYQTAYAIFSPRFIGQLLSSRTDHALRSGLPASRAAELESLIARCTPPEAVSLLELSCYLGDRLLRDTDAASMAVSLEVRVPLIDHEVVSAAAVLAPDVRFGPLGSKNLLKQLAMPGLDHRLFDRPKAGFVLPMDVWIRRAIRSDIDALFNDDRLGASIGLRSEAIRSLWNAFLSGGPGLYWSRVWALFVLLWWCRRHQVFLAVG